MIFNNVQKNNFNFEELHIRHLNLLIDLKNYQFNNWFYRMAIINTFDDLKIFLRNLERNKYKCIIAIHNKKIVGFVYTYPLNTKKTCLKINTPEIIGDFINISRRELIFKLIKTSISSNNINTSNWIIYSDINDNELISCSRELGFQPVQEITLWSKGDFKIYNSTTKLDNLNNYEYVKKSNIKKFLNFVRSNEISIMRNLLDLEQKDIIKLSKNKSGMILNKEDIQFGILKDNSYENKNVYTLIKGILLDYEFNKTLTKIIEILFTEDENIIFKTYSQEKELNNFLKTLDLIEIKQELILVRNTLVKRDLKSVNKINKSWESLLDKINPQGNAFPSPMPSKLK